MLLTGNGPSAKDRGWAFAQEATSTCAAKMATTGRRSGQVDPAGRLHILEVQRLIRFMPKVVIAVVPGWAVGGSHSLHVVCDRDARQPKRDLQANGRGRRQL